MTQTTADARLTALYEAEWRWRESQLGSQSVTTVGTVDDFLPDVGADAQRERLRHWEAVLEQVRAIPQDDLSAGAAVDHAVYQWQLTTLIAQQRHRMYERPLNADTQFWTPLVNRPTAGASAVRTYTKLDTEEDARSYLKQLADIPRFFAQNIENMREGGGRGFAPPAVTMAGRESTIRSVTESAAPDDLRLFAPFTTLPESVPHDRQDDLRTEARALLGDVIVPAYRDLLTFFTTEYRPRLRTEIGALSLPDGEQFYRDQLREYTTTELSPEEIFEIGTSEVASIRAEMEGVAAEVGFAGDLPGLLAFMRTDPQFYATTPEELLREAAWQAKKFDGVVHRYFGRTPRMRFGIEEPPPDVAPFYTFGRGALDRYILNTYNLPARPLYSLPSLTLHEAAPGHAFQTPLALEQDQHPHFRRAMHVSAYAEGWALYCERLGVEMGMYETPFEVMGMLSFQMWRAARLVVDTGIHAFGWSRNEAQEFLRENTGIADHEIATEIDRYISWPGQACAYYLGALRIHELRRRAEAELGQQFSLRSFHDAVLVLGSVPLAVLEQEVDRFIACGGRSPFGLDGTEIDGDQRRCP
ncbi:MAG: DUF885 domain-containing protein [Actinomycetes bacterium]